MTGNPDRRAILFDGDLSEAGLVEQLRQRADRVMVYG
jgi:hypothetical protein